MSKRILVVEDQADSRRIIRDMLAATNYEIIEAEKGGARGCRETAPRPHPDGCPITDYGRLHRHAADQNRSDTAIDPDHRGYFLCARRTGKDREGSGL